MSGIDPTQLRTMLIRPVLTYLGLGGDAAEEMVLGTFIHESGCGAKLMQSGGGPALGLGQIEPATHADLWATFFKYHSELGAKLAALRLPMLTVEQNLAGNLPYACGVTRALYYRHSDPMPAAGDLDGQAAFWKRAFNTPLGAGTEAEYKADWLARFPQAPLHTVEQEA